MRRTDIKDDLKLGVYRAEGAELRKARKSIRLLEQENEALRRAAAYLPQTNLTEKALPAVTELFTDEIPSMVVCGVLKLTCQPHYRLRNSPITDTEAIA